MIWFIQVWTCLPFRYLDMGRRIPLQLSQIGKNHANLTVVKHLLTGLQYCLNFRRKFLVLSYSPKTVMAFLSNEVTELRYICAVFLREVLAGDIFRARCSECVDLEISSGFDVSLFVVEEIIPFVCL